MLNSAECEPKYAQGRQTFLKIPSWKYFLFFSYLQLALLIDFSWHTMLYPPALCYFKAKMVKDAV